MNLDIRGVSYQIDVVGDPAQEPAVVLLHGFSGSGQDWAELLPSLRSMGRAIRHGTRHRRDHNILRSGVVFARVGIRNAEHVAGILYQSMLEAASSPNEWPVAGSRKFDAAQHSFETAVGTPG